MLVRLYSVLNFLLRPYADKQSVLNNGEYNHLAFKAASENFSGMALSAKPLWV